MTRDDKVKIAKDFISYHKYDADDWLLNRTYSQIYEELTQGMYGCVVLNDDGECETEIKAYDSYSGRPVMFTFEAEKAYHDGYGEQLTLFDDDNEVKQLNHENG